MNKFQLTLALCMLITGSINTIATKTVDWQSAVGVFHVCPSWSPSPPSPPSPPSAPSAPSSPPGQPCFFVHPFFQALGMFVGEFSCFLVYFGARFLARLRGLPVDPRSWTTAPRPQFNWFLFLLPACLDMTGTSMMYVGLLMTYASDFQMLRGSVVLFTGAISRIFMKRLLAGHHWIGMLAVVVGTLLVGLDGVIFPSADTGSASNPMLGNLIIVAAQVVVATQMCVEEIFVGGRDVPPLLAVGLEGMFGMGVLSCVLVGMYYLPGVSGLSETRGHLEDSLDALLQLGSGNGILLGFMLASLASIAFFNFFGISVTKAMSAAHRMVLDSLRTMVVWGFSLCVYAVDPSKGQKFSWLQLVGFAILLFGTLVYNEILPLPCLPKKWRKAAATAPGDGNADDIFITGTQPILPPVPEDAVIPMRAGNEPLQPLVGAPRLQADSPASRATLVASTAKLDARR